MDRFSAVILMAGTGQRAASPLPKQFHPLGSGCVYERTLETFRASGIFQEIILVVHMEWVDKVQGEVSTFPEVKVVAGGETRQASSRKGLEACCCDYVMIHDAVRPFVTVEILQANVEAVLKSGAADTCIASCDTIVETEDGRRVDAIPKRGRFWRGQTPQTFAYPVIWQAHLETRQTNASDDCQLVLEMGHPVAIVEGAERNFKITTDWDLKVLTAAEELDRQRTSK